MKQFKEFLKERGVEVDSEPTGPLGMLATDQPDTEGLMRVARMAVENHYGDVMAFFQSLASKDPRIQDELDGMNRNNLNKAPRPRNSGGPGEDNRPEVVPNGADRADGAGLESND